MKHQTIIGTLLLFLSSFSVYAFPEKYISNEIVINSSAEEIYGTLTMSKLKGTNPMATSRAFSRRACISTRSN